MVLSPAGVGPRAADDAARDPLQAAMLPMDDVRPQTLQNLVSGTGSVPRAAGSGERWMLAEGLTAPEAYLQGARGKVGAQALGQRPTNDAAAEKADDEWRVGPAGEGSTVVMSATHSGFSAVG